MHCWRSPFLSAVADAVKRWKLRSQRYSSQRTWRWMITTTRQHQQQRMTPLTSADQSHKRHSPLTGFMMTSGISREWRHQLSSCELIPTHCTLCPKKAASSSFRYSTLVVQHVQHLIHNAHTIRTRWDCVLSAHLHCSSSISFTTNYPIILVEVADTSLTADKGIMLFPAFVNLH